MNQEQIAGSPATADRIARLRNSLSGALLGKPEVIQLALIALLAEGHLLIEDVPGIGKTLLAKALARSLSCTFHRIQFTPDLLPSDLLGTSVFHQTTSEFVFKPGPLFAQIVLADEINRATPRTQSALLEAMSERQVSIDGETRPLEAPFMVIATQNPYEFEGTYPLPESQLDRFLMRVSIGYPDRTTEKEILATHRDCEPVDHLKPVLSAAEVIALQQAVPQVRLSEAVQDYILDVVHATRNHPDIHLGASTRAILAMARATRASALLEGRDFAVPDDAKKLTVPLLGHRILVKNLRPGVRGDSAAAVLAEILDQSNVPV